MKRSERFFINVGRFVWFGPLVGTIFNALDARKRVYDKGRNRGWAEAVQYYKMFPKKWEEVNGSVQTSNRRTTGGSGSC